MVNSIIASIKGDEHYSAFHFLNCIYSFSNKTNGDGNPIFKDNYNKIKSIEIFDEFSFGEFGDPDLIVKVVFKDPQESPMLFFIEAKVRDYASSAGGKKISESYSHNASRIHFQLRLKKRFVDAYFAGDKKEIKSFKGHDLDKDYRVLKKKSVISFINSSIMNGVEKNNIYYISMTNDEENPYVLNKDYLPYSETDSLKEQEFYREHLGFILYNPNNNKDRYPYYIEWEEKQSNAKTVLHGRWLSSYKMAKELADNTYIQDGEED